MKRQGTHLSQLFSIIVLFSILIGGSYDINAQTIQLGSGTNTNSVYTICPVNIYYRSGHMQILYTASEISAAGIAGGSALNSLGWYVTGAPTYALPQYTIKVKHTTATNANSYDATGLTQVYYASSYTPTANQWNMFSFSSPFYWNGTSNILVDVCFAQATAWTSSGQVRTYSATQNFGYYRTDNSNTCGQAPYWYNLNDKPQCKMVFIPPTGFDVGIASIDSPLVLNVGKNKLSVTIQNFKADTVNWIDLGYKIDNGTPTLVNNFNFDSSFLSAGATYKYSFADSMNIPSLGSYTLKVWANNANDSLPDNDPTNDTLTKVMCTGMFGKYTIGATGDYATFNNALNALHNCGVAGPVKFTVQAGTYNERLVLDEIIGMSDVNTVSFDGVNRSLTTLTYAAGGSAGGIATLAFDGGDYFTFKNITITNTGSSNAVVAWFSNNADYNTIDSCDLKLSTTSTNSNQVIVLFSSSETNMYGYGDNGNYNTFSHSNFIGGYFGARLNGSSYQTYSKGNNFIKNTFTYQYYYGIYQYYMAKTTIQLNTFTDFRSQNSYAIYNNYGGGNIYDANYIHPGHYGIYTYRENYYGGDSSKITNNIISDFHYGNTKNNNQSGITLYFYSQKIGIYHNTIVVDGNSNSTNNYAIRAYYFPSGTKIYNNIFVSTDATYFFYLYYPDGLSIDYNLYYYPNNATNNYNLFYAYRWPQTSYSTDLDGFKTFTTGIGIHDVNSWDNIDPHFMSNYDDLHLSTGYPPIKSPYNANVAIDIDGDLRCIYETSLGADESAYPVPPPHAEFLADDTVCFGTPITFVNVNSADAPMGHWWFHNGTEVGTDLHYTYVFPAGSYDDTISVVTENCGGIDTFTKIIHIDTPQMAPIADFIADLNSVETYYPVQFSDLSTNCPSEWLWSIYPAIINHPLLGTVATYSYMTPSYNGSQNPLISFDFPGKYEVCLKVSNLRGADSICKSNYIIVKPSQWLCQFVLPEVEKSLFGILYDDGGPFSNYTDNANCDIKLDPCSKELSFKFSEFNYLSGDYVEIYDGVDENGTPLWNTTTLPNGLTGKLGDPGVDSSYKSNSGKMYIRMVTSNSGNSTGFIGEWAGVLGNYPMPSAYFEGPDTVCLNMPVTFQNLTTDPGYTYSWDFDDDRFADSYAENGEYTFWYIPFNNPVPVRLTVSSCGGDSTFTKLVYINQPTIAPTPDFDADNKRPAVSTDIVTLIDMSYECVDSWEWTIMPDSMYDDFGLKVPAYRFVNGTNRTSQNPQVIFDTTGCFDIKLKAGYQLTYYDSLTENCFINVIEYCIPRIGRNKQGQPNLNPDIGISRVKLSEIDNSSGIGLAEYTDYTNTVSTPLDLSAQYTLTMERGTAYNDMNRKAWIDWNIDGDFDDAGELIGSESGGYTLSWSTTFTVPASAVKGPTRLRVATSLGTMSNEACGVNMYGEYEDYRLIIREDGTPPDITILGQELVTLKQCQCDYYDSGAVAVDNISGTVPVDDTTNFDCEVPGTYWWRYTAEDSVGNIGSKERVIVVEADDVPPTISLLGNLVDTIEVYNTFTDMGYVEDDTCSGIDRVDIAGTVDTTKLGSYDIVYTAYDLEGNSASATRTIYVLDRTDPIISLKGKSVVTHEVNNPFVDPGVDISDNYCAPGQLILDVNGTVNSSLLGTYTLTYSVTDCNGNGPVSVVRIVDVVDTLAPVITSAMYNDFDTITIEVYDKFIMPLLKVNDNYYKTYSESISGTFVTNFPDGTASDLGYFTYVFSAEDGSGNASSFTFIIRVVDTEAPVITLAGEPVINLCRFKEFENDSASVSDNFDKNLTITKGGTYSTYLTYKAVGLYTITYDAVDNSGNVANQVVRYINVEECPWLSIDGTDLGQYINIYPNPTTGKFVIDMELPADENVTVSIVNTLGKVVKVLELGHIYGGLFTVDMNNFSKGMYMVRIQTDEQIVVKRIDLVR